MLFNTFVFLVFFTVVYIPFLLLGLLAKSKPSFAKFQNAWLLFASYFFYGWWEWFFLSLIFFSTAVDYFAANAIAKSTRSSYKKFFLSLSIFCNLGLLFTLKYFHFFTVSLTTAWNSLASPLGGTLIQHEDLYFLQNFILPVGISFYTFQTMSYTIDVYRGQIAPEKNPLDFALFVNFFPQLVAGPIERASDLLSQLKQPKLPAWSEIPFALWEILLGYFMKVYVADNIGKFVDDIYLASKAQYIQNPSFVESMDGSQVFVSSYGILFQLFCDFGGYSFIAMGTARLLGVKLTLNFDTPEFSKNPIEFWNRWHSTLNRWFRDYVYIPLGGSKFGKWSQIRNLMVVFFLSGLWHGANWTYLTWGALNGFFTFVYLVYPRKESQKSDFMRDESKDLKWGVTLSILEGFFFRFLMVTLVGITGIAFRCYDWDMLVLYFQKAFSFWNWQWNPGNSVKPAYTIFGEFLKILFPLLVIDGLSYFKKDRFWIFKQSIWIQGAVISFLCYLILTRGIFGKEVIYFAF